MLRAFFRDQRTQPVAHVATLLGWSHAEVTQRAAEENIPTRDGCVPWSYVVAWLFEQWSYEWVILALGADVDLLPVGLRAVPVVWVAPAWVVHGLNVQRQIEPLPHRTVRPHTLSDYLTDFLSRGIGPDTVAALRGDRDFMEAFDFPDGGVDV